MKEHELLTCPQCKCPLSAPAKSVTGITCPRCNSWVEIDPDCSGSCLSCHQLHSAAASGSCATQHEPLSEADKKGAGLWKALLKRFF